MAIIKSFSDLEQSRKLVEILSLESADMFYVAGKGEPIFIGNKMVAYGDNDYDALGGPDVLCWSLAALRNLLPTAIKPNKDSYLFLFESHNTFDNSWVYRYYNEDNISYLYCKNTNEIDACYEMVLKLNELNLL